MKKKIRAVDENPSETLLNGMWGVALTLDTFMSHGEMP